MTSFACRLLCLAVLSGLARSQGDSFTDVMAGLNRVLAERGSEASARQPWVLKLVTFDQAEARDAAARLWKREREPRLRARLLRHAGKSKLMGDESMLAALEGETAIETRFVAAAWFLTRHQKQGLELLQTLLKERASAQLETAVFAACAAASPSSAAGQHFKANFPLLPPTRQLPVLELLADGGIRESRGDKTIAALRADLLEDAKWAPLRAEALRQMSATADERAKPLARKLLKKGAKRIDPKLASAVFEALTREPEEADYPKLGPMLELRGSGIAPLARDFVAKHASDPSLLQWARTRGLEDKSPGGRLLALRVLERDTSKMAGDGLFALTGDRDDDVRRRAVAALAVRGDTRIRPLLEKWIDGGPLERRMDALESLAKLRTDPAFTAKLFDLAGNAPTELRMLAIRLGARRGAREFLPLLPELLSHGDWRVVSVGLELARRVRDASSVPLLIKLVARAKGRTLAETKQALKELTRLFYESARGWTQWWARDGSTFVLPPAEGEDVGKKVDAAKPTPADAGGTTASFYGIPVESRRVAFCLDVSGSMGELAGTGVSRLSIAKRSLLRALERLPKGTRVHVIFFDAEIHRFSKRMTTFDPKKMEKLEKFVDAQTPLGETNLWGALDAALEDKNVDTIYVLSDGEPSVGEVVDVREFGDEILRLNRRRSVLFHTIAIGAPSPLLERLSKESGGLYVVQK